MANAFDMTDYQKKDLTSAIRGQSTVESALGEISSDLTDVEAVVPSRASSSNKLVVENYLLEDTTTSDPVTILTNNIGSFSRGTYNVTVKTSRWSYGITLFMWTSAYWSAIVQSYGYDTSTEKVVCNEGTITRQKLVTESGTIVRYDLTASANTFAAVKTALETFYTSSTATMRTPYCGYITASGAVWWYEFEKVDANYGYGELRYYDVDNTWYTFRVGTGVFTYQPVLNAELLSASNTFTPSSGYEILDWNVNQLGNHVWGTFILHKTSGDIPAVQTEVGNFSSTLRNAVNSVCFCSNNRYGGSAFYTGYLFIDSTGKMLMGNPSGTTTGINYAKISIDFCLA
jgi:hypothetical protein